MIKRHQRNKNMNNKLTKIAAGVVLASTCLLSACQQNIATIEKISPSTVISKQDLPKMSVQLWSVNKTLAKDFKGTLTAIADMGFDGVEFAGDFGPYADDPQELKNFLAELGLVVSGAHVGMAHFSDESFQKTVDFYKAIGAPMLIIPIAKEAFDSEKINDWIEKLNVLQVKIAENGMRFGFHNHDEEFLPYGDSTFWDQLASNTNDDFILQMDVGWVTFAGKDPVEFINKYPGRTITSHYKAKFPYDNMPEGKLPYIGQDITNWPNVIVSQSTIGGTQWMVIEQEEYPNGATQLEAVEISKQGLDKIIAAMFK